MKNLRLLFIPLLFIVTPMRAKPLPAVVQIAAAAVTGVAQGEFCAQLDTTLLSEAEKDNKILLGLLLIGAEWAVTNALKNKVVTSLSEDEKDQQGLGTLSSIMSWSSYVYRCHNPLCR